MTGSNRRLPPCKGEGEDDENGAGKGLAASDVIVCTRVCTSSPENADDELLQGLVDDLRARLSVDQCRRLAELSVGE